MSDHEPTAVPRGEDVDGATAAEPPQVRAATAGVLALLVGATAWWATSYADASLLTFAVTAAASAGYLYTKAAPARAIAHTLYLMAGLAFLSPVGYWASTGFEWPARAWVMEPSLVGRIAWLLGFIVLAGALATGGFVVGRYA